MGIIAFIFKIKKQNSKVLLSVAHSGQELKAFVSTIANLLSTPFQEVRSEEGFPEHLQVYWSHPVGMASGMPGMYREADRWEFICVFLLRIPWCWCNPIYLIPVIACCFWKMLRWLVSPLMPQFYSPPAKAVSTGIKEGEIIRDTKYGSSPGVPDSNVKAGAWSQREKYTWWNRQWAGECIFS